MVRCYCHFFAVVVCSVCKGEGGEIEGLAPVSPVCLVSLRLCTAYNARAGFICYPSAGSH